MANKVVHVSENEKACKKLELSECHNEGNNKGAISLLNSIWRLKFQYNEENDRISGRRMCIKLKGHSH